MSEELLKVIISDIKEMKETMGRMEDRMGGMESRMDSMEGRMDTMQSTLNEHTQLLQALEHRVEENTAQLITIAEDVNQIKGETTNLKAEVYKQGLLINGLAAQSANHDTDIKILKKAVAL